MEKIKSPIVWMGNKYRLIDFIFDSIPKDINNFYDLFGGSGTISLNASKISNVVHYNELNKDIYMMFNLIVGQQDIMNHLYKREKQFELMQLTKEQESDIELGKIYKERFDKYRNFVNITKPLDYKDIFVLMKYSFNGLIRFSQQHKFNAPFSYTERSLGKWIIKSQKVSKDIITTNNSFENVININKIGKKDFVYVDPPYMNTTAVYNENRLTGWNMDNEQTLFSMLEELDKKGAKWAMSNIYGNSKVSNSHLEQWCKKNGWFVEHLNIKYSTFGKKDKVNDEVLITNYNSRLLHKQIGLFDDLFGVEE